MRIAGIALLIVLTGAGCASDPTDGALDDPEIRRMIGARILAFETIKGARAWQENVEILGIQMGSPAVPLLQDALATAESSRIRAGCALALGRTLREEVRDDLWAVARNDPNEGVRYTAASALLGYRDVRAVEYLIEHALRSEEPVHRVRAIEVLHTATGRDFGYEARGMPAEREAAVLRWERWLSETGPDGVAVSINRRR